jgi:hypothetical protein
MTYVALPILVEPTTGGWISYTAHLTEGLIRAGYTPIILRPAKRTESTTRPFTRGLVYINATPEEMARTAKEMPTIVTAVDRKNREALPALLDAGASLVIHDPTEIDAEFIKTLNGADIITIRKIISDKLTGLGLTNRYTPHPYHRADKTTADKTHGTIALSRIDWDKRTHTIIEANKQLPEDKQITIFGALNRLYDHHKLTTVDPEWRRNYAGQWSSKESLSYPVELARRATQVVDLSVISGDGGGTQYSFLEALDAGTPLTIHKEWLTGNPDYDEMAPATTQVATAEELVEQVMNPAEYDYDAAEHILNQHDAAKVARLTLSTEG